MSLESRANVTLEATLDPMGRDLILDAIDAIEAVEARQVIELAIVRLAAVRRTEVDLQRLRALLDGMRECRNRPTAFAEFDFALHVALAKAARNTLLANSLSALYDGMHEMISRFATTAAAENRMDSLIQTHARLVEAIGRHDADEAALIVSDMMTGLRVESGRSWPRTADRARAHQVSEIGMLDNRPHEKGDRP